MIMMTNMDTDNAIKEAEQSDIDNSNKAMAILAYILFIIPLLAAKESKYARYHANQGLVLLLAVSTIHIVGAMFSLTDWMMIIPIGMLSVLVAAAAVIGVLHAVNGRMKPMPFIGKLKLIQQS